LHIDAFPLFAAGTSVGDWAQILALPLALLVAWFTVRASSLDQRKSIILDDLVDHIRETQQHCNDLCKRLQDYLTGDLKRLTLQDAYKNLLIGFKEAGRNAEHLGMFFDERLNRQIGDMHQVWWRELTRENVPVRNKKDFCKPNDATIKRIQDAQITWDKYLAELKHKCFQEEIVYWKVKRRLRRWRF
jgi:hypothetical protein